MAREGRGLRGMMMADYNANTLAGGRDQIPSPSPEINANVMMIRDRGSCLRGLNYFLQFIIQFSFRGEKILCARSMSEMS